MLPKLILMRHGKSIWNKLNLFTGWVDIPLSEEGITESLEGGRKISDTPIDAVYTSTLIRAQMTAALALLHHSSGKTPVFHHLGIEKTEEWSKVYNQAMQKAVLPIYTAWELNERMYGTLQGLNKAETAKRFGIEQVHLWRRSYEMAPPEGESLAMTVARAVPYFKKHIVPHLARGESVLVVAHGNSLRGIMMYLEGLSKEEVVKLEVATGIPFFYIYDQGQWKKE